ncbi:hypothetical protein TSUD_58860 [Trifolium subterraneum]|uniref:Uncharacterized protein n=1 Tax=Trifolium subterraneum TaxID=3900 RepID=A0A2Z6MZE9_TRISU|nr:hypothetical protein TSUD_58860 [Trifolium subterraneum]
MIMEKIRGKQVFGDRPRPSSKLEPSSSSQDKPVLEDDSDSHSLLTMCSGTSTVGEEKGTTKQSSDSDFHSTVKVAVKDLKKEKKSRDGSEEKRGKKTKIKSL